jgi:hypothetical protein
MGVIWGGHTMTTTHPLERWHQLVRQRSLEGLEELLAEEVVFYSPVLFKPQNGKALTTFYLAGALQVLGNDKTQDYDRDAPPSFPPKSKINRATMNSPNKRGSA